MSKKFCTLFDKNYLFRGLAMYYSLTRHCPEAVLYILCLDAETKELLEKLALPQARLLTLQEFEDSALLAVKSTRTFVEYCWTMGSSLLWYVLDRAVPGEVVGYLDSDLFFFSSPQSLFTELSDQAVLIVRHNYESRFNYLESRSGIYNVAIVLARNDERGRECVGEWREQCLKWCYNRYEEGKFGDQKYLDNWPTRYRGVVVSGHPGADVAPWNINRYRVTMVSGQVYINNDPLIFYHFHSLKMFSSGSFQLFNSSYDINKETEQYIYEPYLAALEHVAALVRQLDQTFIFGYNKAIPLWQRCYNYLKKIVVKLFLSKH